VLGSAIADIVQPEPQSALNRVQFEKHGFRKRGSLSRGEDEPEFYLSLDVAC
jgi:hypothetical protein